MVDFKQMKKNRDKQLEAIVTKMTETTSYKDARYWELKKNKDGNGSAVIRWLPAPGDEQDAYITFLKYIFKYPTTNQWYIERSRRSLGPKEPDPAAEYVSQLFALGNQKDEIKKIGRSNRYVANIYVEKHPAAPEDEGKVFLYEYGAKIHEMNETALIPEFEGQARFNPFDLWGGASLNLRFKKGVGTPGSYDASSWNTPAPLFVDADGKPDDAQMEEVWKKAYSLVAEAQPDKYKSYDELLERFNFVLGLAASETVAAPRQSTASAASSARKPTAAKQQIVEPAEEDDTGDTSFFARFDSEIQASADDDIPF